VNYHVRWSRAALDRLTELWTQANSTLRQAITSATHQLDTLLQRDAATVGESRPGGRRILFQPPLGLLYRVEADQRTVSVLRVWLFRQRGKIA
jgi:plasmid stabilization system protein ParE